MRTYSAKNEISDEPFKAAELEYSVGRIISNYMGVESPYLSIPSHCSEYTFYHHLRLTKPNQKIFSLY